MPSLNMSMTISNPNPALANCFYPRIYNYAQTTLYYLDLKWLSMVGYQTYDTRLTDHPDLGTIIIHRDDDCPARFDSDDPCKFQEWYQYGRLHRIGKPAVMTPTNVWWYINGDHEYETERYCELCEFDKETTVLWLLKYGEQLPNDINDL